MAILKQIQKLQCLYRELGLVEHKREILLRFTNGRTDSTAGLTTEEAAELIKRLAKHDPKDRLRKAVFAFARRAGIIYGETEEDKKMNHAKLNMFLRERGAVKKNIEQQSFDELKKTMAQFAAIVKNNAQCADNKDAKKLTDELMDELNLQTTGQ